MKQTIKSILVFAAVLLCGGAWASQLYVDKLDTGAERIPNGTYGEGASSIGVPGYGIKATTYAQTTQIGDSNSSIKNVFGNSLSVVTHTVSGWFKVDALPASGNKTIYAAISYAGDYGGYKLAVDNTGKLIVGRINGNNYNFHNNGTEYVTMANTALVANQWYYITVAVSWANSNVMTPTVYVNGESCAVSGTPTTFTGGLNGGTFKHFDIGAGVSAAGLYADNTAITDASVIKSLAVSSDTVSIIHLAQLVNKADGAVEATYDAYDDIESSITINEGKELQIVAPPDGGVMDFSSSVSGAGDLRFIGLDDQRTVSAESDLGTTAKTVLNNVKLDAIIPIGAKLSGSGIGSTPLDAHICNVVRGSSGITFQAQVKNDGWIKTVKVLLAQSGEDVTAKVAWSRYAPAASYPLGADLEYKYQNSGSYDIRDIVLNVTGGINVTATGSGNNTNHTGATIVDNCFLKTSNLGALSDAVQAVNGAEVALTRTNGAYNNSGYGQVIEAQAGSRVVLSANDFVLGYNDKIFCNGGTVEYVAGSWAGKNLYIGNIELSEGGVLGGSGRIRIGNYCNSTIKATGNATILNAQLQPYGSTSSTGKTGTFDVADGKTLTVYANVVKASDQGWDKLALKKTGSGTVEFRRSVTDGTANTETLTIDEGVVIANGYDSFCQNLTVNNDGAYSISAATSKTISGAGEIWMTANNLSFDNATLTSFTGHIVIKSGVTYTCAPSALPAKLKIEPNGTWAYTHEGKSVTIAATDATKSLYYENGAIKIVNAEVTSVDVTKFLYPGISSVDVSGCTALAEVYVGSSGDFSAEFAKVTGVGNDVTIVVVETPAEYANGALTISNVPEEMVSRIKVKRPGIAELVTPIAGSEANTLTINDSTIKISGAATSFDITYTNSQAFVYKAVSGAASQADSTITYNKQGEGHDVGARLRHHPYINNIGNAWFEATEALTLAVVGTMSEQPRTTFIHMGYSIGGYTGLLIATGDKKDEVIIGWNENNASTDNKPAVHEITRMSVPNAASERHVYIVTKSDVGDKSTFTVYLDGKEWKTVSIDRITIKGGVQVGSDFGGLIHGYDDPTKSWYDPESENYFAAVAATDNTGLVNLIRVYDRVITKAEIAEYSKEDQYPYYPPYGASTRVFAGETANWIENDEPPTAWSVTPKGGSASSANAPTEGSSLSTTLSAENTAVTINVPAEGVAYEELEVIGSGSATFVKGTDSGAIRVSGAATLYRPITVKPGSIDLSKTPITLSEDGAIHFDYSSYNVMTTYVTTKVNLTGEVVKNNEKITFTPPTTSNYRTVTMSYDEDLKQYVMTIAPNHENGASVYYDTTSDVTSGNQGGRVWNASENPKAQTAVFPNDTIVFGYGSFNKPSWFFKDVGGSIYEFASNMSLGHGASGDAGKLFDGKTVKVNEGVTLTLRSSWRSVALGTVTTTGTGSIEFVADEDNEPYYAPTADAISGTAKIIVASGMTLTVSGSVGCPVEVNGTIKAGSEITTVTTTKANCFVAMTVEDGVYTYTAVEVTGDKPLPLDDIKPGESVTPAQDMKPIWSDTTPVEGEGGKYIKVVDGALVVKEGAPVNGLDSFKSYVLGLDPEDATSKPYLSGADTTSATTLKLIPGGVTVKAGYTVTPKLRVGTTPTAFEDDSTALSDGGFTITLPTEENDKVKYYQIEYTITK